MKAVKNCDISRRAHSKNKKSLEKSQAVGDYAMILEYLC